MQTGEQLVSLSKSEEKKPFLVNILVKKNETYENYSIHPFNNQSEIYLHLHSQNRNKFITLNPLRRLRRRLRTILAIL